MCAKYIGKVKRIKRVEDRLLLNELSFKFHDKYYGFVVRYR